MIITFLTPAVILYVLVFLYPTVRTIIMSFFSVESVSDPISSWTFNGLGNFALIFSSNLFVKSMQNMGKLWLFGGIGVMILSLLFAIVLTSGMRGKSFYRSVIYLPNVVSAVAMGTMWLNYVYQPDYGLFNNVINFFGGSPLMWTGPNMLFWSMLIAYCFGMVGYHMLIFMSGIESIGMDYYEAASIEGATIFQKFYYITLPFLRGVIRTNLVMWTVTTVGFFVWGQLFSPVNLSENTSMPLNYMYEMVFGSSSSALTVRNSGAGAAIGVLMAAVVVVVFMLTNFIVKNDDTEI
ncbi:MAG: sugar ABC transporter permease [Lachnospiraceae bacterium]